MKSVYEIKWGGPTLLLNSKIRAHHKAGHRIVWNYLGLKGVVPPAVLDAEFAIMDAFESRRHRAYDAPPVDVGLVRWEQVVMVPPVP